uniref:Microtubule-associated proteins 1A/1B light chain 3C-like n=1 Tax=Crocodylus porosus TaxID=8502 RepID=A0A7M4F659_CROPO
MLHRQSSCPPFKRRKSLGGFWGQHGVGQERCLGGCNRLCSQGSVSLIVAMRMREVLEICARHPTKIPVVVEWYQKEKHLPLLDCTKFLVSQDLSLSQFLVTLRTRMSLTSTQAFYLLVNNRGLPSLSTTLGEVYRDSRDDDGFLYMTYASQDMFGAPVHAAPRTPQNTMSNPCP